MYTQSNQIDWAERMKNQGGVNQYVGKFESRKHKGLRVSAKLSM